jgi:hypothetical protein
MKHATPATLRQLEPLLARIRGLGGLVERMPVSTACIVHKEQ